VRNNSQLLYITAKRQKIRVLPYWQGSQYHTTAVERSSSTFSLEIKKQMDLIEMGVYFLKKGGEKTITPMLQQKHHLKAHCICN